MNAMQCNAMQSTRQGEIHIIIFYMFSFFLGERGVADRYREESGEEGGEGGREKACGSGEW